MQIYALLWKILNFYFVTELMPHPVDVAVGQSRQNGVERKEQIVPPEQACGRIWAAQAPSAVYLLPELIWSCLL